MSFTQNVVEVGQAKVFKIKVNRFVSDCEFKSVFVLPTDGWSDGAMALR